MSVNWSGNDTTIAAALRALGVESDLGDAQLASKARAAIAEIAKHTGMGSAAIESYADGGKRYVVLDPPASSITTVTENEGAATLTAGDDGYRLHPGGRLLERLSGGSASRFSGTVHVTYAAAATDDRYDRVVTDLVKLSLEYTGLDMRRDGDYSETAAGANSGGQTSYQDQRVQIISELQSGVWLR